MLLPKSRRTGCVFAIVAADNGSSGAQDSNRRNLKNILSTCLRSLTNYAHILTWLLIRNGFWRSILPWLTLMRHRRGRLNVILAAFGGRSLRVFGSRKWTDGPIALHCFQWRLIVIPKQSESPARGMEPEHYATYQCGTNAAASCRKRLYRRKVRCEMRKTFWSMILANAVLACQIARRQSFIQSAPKSNLAWKLSSGKVQCMSGEAAR